MKERTTFLVPRGHGIDAAAIDVDGDELRFHGAATAMLQRRLTLTAKEVPSGILNVLDTFKQLHIRWTSYHHHHLSSPFSSRMPAGLHVFLGLREDYDETEHIQRCYLLRQAFDPDMNCGALNASFSRLSYNSEQHSSMPSHQFYHGLTSIENFQRFISENLCNGDATCKEIAAEIRQAVSIDIDFMHSSRQVTFTALWPVSETHDVTTRSISKHRVLNTVEVGVLEGQKADEQGEIKLGGYLAVLGESQKPCEYHCGYGWEVLPADPRIVAATVFSFPSRHQLPPPQSRLTYSAHFQNPTGLHPTLAIGLSTERAIPPHDSCALYAYFALPSAIFLDRYQFLDELFLISQNLEALESLTGEEDLEAPDWIRKQWGSTALFRLATPSRRAREYPNKQELWTATIPLHLRYINNHSEGSKQYGSISVPWPSLFWACEKDAALDFSDNPFDRTHLGYDHFFSENTVFYHISPQRNDHALSEGLLLEKLSIPILPADSTDLVSTGTLFAVVIGFAWTCWQLLRAISTRRPIMQIQDPSKKK